MRRSVKLIVASATIVIGLAGLVSIAWAFFTAGGTGAAAASTASMAAPTNAHAVANGGAVTITWTDSVAPDGGAVDGYYVTRDNGTTVVNACGSSSSNLVPSTNGPTCVDNVGDGTYSYRVIALWRSWTSTSAASNSVTVINDAAAPSATVTFPANNQQYSASTYAAGCSTPAADICGTATDSAGVALVRVSIKSQTNNKYWSGSTFSLSSETFQAATLTPATGTSVAWSYALPTPGTGGYTIDVQAKDANGNEQTGTTYAVSSAFTVDATPPTVTLEQKSPGQNDPTNAAPVHFTATFSEPVTGFSSAGVSLSGTGVTGSSAVTVTGSGAAYDVAVDNITDNGTSGTVIASLTAGAAVDVANNPSAASTSTDNSITYDATKPTVTINKAAVQADPTKASPIVFTVVFSEPVVGFTSGDVSLSGAAGATTVALSGTGPTYTATVSGMTSNGSVIASIAASMATDNAGNTSTASTSTDNNVLYDTVAPVTTDDASSAWTNQSVTVTLSPSDAAPASGVAHTYYTTNGSTPTTSSSEGTSISLTNEGVHTIKYFSIDNAGNSESVKTAANQVRIDKTLPSISMAATKSGGAAYTPGTWSGVAVNVTSTCADTAGSANSGIATCPGVQSFTSSGTYTATGNAVDAAGNSQPGSLANIMVDVTNPTGSVTSPAAAASVGGTVSLTTDAADAHSGVASVKYQYRAGTSGTFTDIGTVSSSPFSGSWNTLSIANGSYQLHAIITDGVGNSTTTTPFSVTVSNTFTVSLSTNSITAGGTTTVTVTAKAAGVTNTAFTGTVTLSGPSASPSRQAMSPTTIGITSGSGSAAVSLYNAETVAISVASANGFQTGTSPNITVAAGAAAKLAWTNHTVLASAPNCLFSCVVSSGFNNQSFVSKVSVTDTYGNTVSDVGTTKTVVVSVTAGGGTLTAPSGGTTASKTLTFASTGLAETTVSFTFKAENGGQSWTDSIKASGSNIADLADATASFSK